MKIYTKSINLKLYLFIFVLIIIYIEEKHIKSSLKINFRKLKNNIFKYTSIRNIHL